MPNDGSQMRTMLASFKDPETARRYGDGPRRFMPGMDDLHSHDGDPAGRGVRRRMGVCWCSAPVAAWSCGPWHKPIQAGRSWASIPAAAMLDEARRLLGPDAARVTFCEGYIDDAPDGPFDAATCLLTLHFLNVEERTRAARELHRRLKPGGPFVAAHGSFPQGEGGDVRSGCRATLRSRVRRGPIRSRWRRCARRVDAHVPMLDPEQGRSHPAECGLLGCRAVLRRLHLARLGCLHLSVRGLR